MKNIKIKKKTIIIAGAAAAVLIAVLIIITAVHMSSRPKINDSVFPSERTIEYNNKTYTPALPISLCRFEKDDCVYKSFDIFARSKIYTVKNDTENNFLIFYEWDNNMLYTSIPDFEEKYPNNEYTKSRATAVEFTNSSTLIDNYYTESSEVINFINRIESYSNGTQATYPLRESDGFTCEVFIYMDNMPVSDCCIGEIAHYDGKWIFKNESTEFEGTAGPGGTDTRTFTGIEITDESAIKFLEQLCSEHLPYMLEEQ